MPLLRSRGREWQESAHSRSQPTRRREAQRSRCRLLSAVRLAGDLVVAKRLLVPILVRGAQEPADSREVALKGIALRPAVLSRGCLIRDSLRLRRVTTPRMSRAVWRSVIVLENPPRAVDGKYVRRDDPLHTTLVDLKAATILCGRRRWVSALGVGAPVVVTPVVDP